MTAPAPRRARYIVAALVAAGAAFAVLYGKPPQGAKESSGQCAASDAAIARSSAFRRGEVAAASSARQAAPLIALDFLAPDGSPTSLAALRGKTVLLNLWATWCVPCREEMPSLDRLQAMLGSERFEVAAINIDTSRLERPKAFLREIGVGRLAYYSDPKADVFYRLKTAGKAVGLPTSILIGPDGCEIAAMAGPANWASDDALALIKAALGGA